MSDKNAHIAIVVDSAAADAKLDQLNKAAVAVKNKNDQTGQQITDTEKKTDAAQKKADTTLMSARQTWGYVNQLTTMFLTNLEKIAGGSEKTAWIQTALASASLVQQEFAIKRLIAESVAAYSTGNVITGSILAALAATMQITAAGAYTTRLQSIQTESQASRIRQQIETYRS